MRPLYLDSGFVHLSGGVGGLKAGVLSGFRTHLYGVGGSIPPEDCGCSGHSLTG